MISPNRDIGAMLGVVPAGAAHVIAGGAFDGVEQDGETVNRATFGMPESAIVALGYVDTLQAAETYSQRLRIQESLDGSTWITIPTAGEILALTVQETGASTLNIGSVFVKVNLAKRAQYVRMQSTVTISTASVDIVTYAMCWVFGPGAGTHLLPTIDGSDE